MHQNESLRLKITITAIDPWMLVSTAMAHFHQLLIQDSYRMDHINDLSEEEWGGVTGKSALVSGVQYEVSTTDLSLPLSIAFASHVY